MQRRGAMMVDKKLILFSTFLILLTGLVYAIAPGDLEIYWSFDNTSSQGFYYSDSNDTLIVPTSTGNFQGTLPGVVGNTNYQYQDTDENFNHIFTSLNGASYPYFFNHWISYDSGYNTPQGLSWYSGGSVGGGISLTNAAPWKFRLLCEGTGWVTGSTVVTSDTFYMLTVVGYSNYILLYLNGTLEVNATGCSSTVPADFKLRTEKYDADNSPYEIDEFFIGMGHPSSAEMTSWYNNGAGGTYDDLFAGGGPPPPGVNITWITPTPNNNTINNTQVKLNAHGPAGCNISIFFGSDITALPRVRSTTTNLTEYNTSAGTDDRYYYTGNCGFNQTNSSIRHWVYDTTHPQLVTDFVNGTFALSTLTGSFNFTDDNYVHYINISIGSNMIGYVEPDTTTYSYNLSYSVLNLSLGTHLLNLRYADGHTKNKIDEFKVKQPKPDKIKYEFKDNNFIEVTQADDSTGDVWDTYKITDRYIQILEPAVPKDKIVLNVYSRDPIKIIQHPDKYKGEWIITGNYWQDFVLPNEPQSTVKIKRINDYHVEVTIKDIFNNPEHLEFHSIGELNVVDRSYTFEKINFSIQSVTALSPVGNNYVSPSDVIVGTCNVTASAGFNYSYMLQWYKNGIPFYNATTFHNIYNNTYTIPNTWPFNLTLGKEVNTYGHVISNFGPTLTTRDGVSISTIGTTLTSPDMCFTTTYYSHPHGETFTGGVGDYEQICVREDSGHNYYWINITTTAGGSFVFNVSSTVRNVSNLMAPLALIDYINSTYLNDGDNWTLSCKGVSGSLDTGYTNSTVIRSTLPGIDFCTNSYGIPNNKTILNATIYDESSLTLLNVNFTGTLYLRQSNVDVRNYSISLKNVNNFSVCVYPNDDYDLSAYFQYESANGAGINERYYIDDLFLNSSGEVNQLFLYNFADNTGVSILKATLYNYYYQAYPNVLMQMLRYYPSENAWRLVQVDKSDGFGIGIFYVYQDDFDYKFIWKKDGSIISTTDGLKFECDAADKCEQIFIVPLETEASNYRGMTYYSSYNNVTGIYSFTWSDSNNLVQSVRLLVQKQGSNAFVDICDSTTTASAGTMTCNVSAYTGIIKVQAIRTASPPDLFFNEFLERAVSQLKHILRDNGRGGDGNVFAFMIAFVLIGFGAATGSPMVVVLMGIFSFIVNFLFQLADVFGYAVMIGITCIGLIVAYMLNK